MPLAVLLLALLTATSCVGGVPTLGTSEADRGPPGSKTAEQGEREEPGASGVATACAADGVPVDLVAEGTVERVGVGPDYFLLTESRVERVLEGSAGETVLVKTGSGTVGSGYVPYFEEGDRDRLHLHSRT